MPQIVPKAYTILWVENRRVKVPDLRAALRPQWYEVHVVASGRAAAAFLAARAADLVVLYAASFGSSGYLMAKSLRAAAPHTPILLIASPEAPPHPQSPVSEVLVLPFTPRKLLNRIRRLLPRGEDAWQQVGKFALNHETRWVRVDGKEAPLTPRLARLLAYFLSHPYQVLTYQELYRAVWNGSGTPVLDTIQVHIAWLRRIVEQDPHVPCFIETLRGVGYRFHPEGKAGCGERPRRSSKSRRGW